MKAVLKIWLRYKGERIINVNGPKVRIDWQKSYSLNSQNKDSFIEIIREVLKFLVGYSKDIKEIEQIIIQENSKIDIVRLYNLAPKKIRDSLSLNRISGLFSK